MLEALLTPTCSDPVKWLQDNVTLPPAVSPNYPGPLRLDRQPWMEEPLRAVLDPSLREMVLVMGTQTGKTLLMLNAMLLLTVFDPLPLLWGLPDDDLADHLAKTRAWPMLQACPAAASLIPPHTRPANGELLLRTMPMYYLGASVPSKLSSRPVAYLFLDEAAKYRHRYRHEAHPIDLLLERQKGFPRRLALMASTPNVEEAKFWQHFLLTDQRHFFLPCPHCGEYRRLEFSKKTLVWDSFEGMTAADVRRTARYLCPACGHQITDTEKFEAMRQGEWRPLRPQADPSRRGYHLSSLYSAFLTFGEFAAAYWQAVHSPHAAIELQNFKNSWEALPYVFYSAASTPENVRALRSTYRRGELPPDYHYLITCYDPGEKMTHWVTTAVCPGGVLYVVDWGTLQSYVTDYTRGLIGPCAHIDTLFYSADKVRPALGYVDSGDWTETIYSECDSSAGVLTPTKGTVTRGATWGETKIKTRPHMRLLTYSDHTLKNELYDHRIFRASGTLLLPSDADADLMTGLSSQKLQIINGQRAWKRVPDDHYGDCIKLALLSWWVNRADYETDT